MTHDLDHADLGTMTRDGTQCALTFTRDLAHPVEKVWRAVTEAEHTASWFPHTIIGEWKVGAPLQFSSEMGSFDGRVIAVEPPRLLEFTWGDDRLRIELQPTAGGTRLLFIDTFDEVGKGARDGAGWHECLDRLVLVVDGGQLPRWNEGWAALNARYQVSLGPEASTIGPPPDWEPAGGSD
jgi:uncharacterized protein YndB with AHSA1/START domain